MYLYVSITLMSKTENINWVEKCGKNGRQKVVIMDCIGEKMYSQPTEKCQCHAFEKVSEMCRKYIESICTTISHCEPIV
jgi:hypothetical protein